MNHLEFAQLESFVSESENAWLDWANECEKALGHSLDGDYETDGYSMDGAYSAWQSGVSIADFVATVNSNKLNKNL